jgi:hypothetical protein
MVEVWTSAGSLVKNYDGWHQARVEEMAQALLKKVNRPNNAASVGAKFLNTFMHQLMKYEWARPLWPALHLPLDARVFKSLRIQSFPALASVRPLLRRSPYILSYAQHLEVQEALSVLARELNMRIEAEFRIRSRIELNLLWI